MLFVLDPSLDEILANESHRLHEQLCLELDRIGTARQRQKLLLFIESPKFIELALASSRLNSRTKGVLLSVHRARAFKGALARRLRVKCSIVADGDSCTTSDAGGSVTIRVPVEHVPFGLFDSCVVLAENIDDAKAYLVLARMRMAGSREGLQKVPLKGELRGGGGSAIEREYLQIKGAGERLALCLLDDDVRHPGGNPSGWRARIISDDLGRPSALTAHFCLGAYSIEGVLPLGAFAELSYFKDPSRSHAVAADVAIWARHAAEAHWPFLALKKSVKCQVFRQPDDEGSYWRNVGHHFQGYSSKNCGRAIATCSSSCDRLPKYSDQTLREFATELENAPDERLAPLDSSIPAAVSARVTELARVVSAWCCVGRPLGALAA